MIRLQALKTLKRLSRLINQSFCLHKRTTSSGVVHNPLFPVNMLTKRRCSRCGKIAHKDMIRTKGKK